MIYSLYLEEEWIKLLYSLPGTTTVACGILFQPPKEILEHVGSGVGFLHPPDPKRQELTMFDSYHLVLLVLDPYQFNTKH